ncbi:hypothetical protein SBOR_7087 [Sclerotinia borealis F-4128]|uniref:ADP-ribose 1''-phosphate phosphatase n=1 Tax=Sclerotinia borealis (strain F-4128) TaxID=1432307 RepID=W9CD81_SCLBF|nr:hypothetical protein SBOR_7087 [Sclerotinia borealis F-4128]
MNTPTQSSLNQKPPAPHSSNPPSKPPSTSPPTTTPKTTSLTTPTTLPPLSPGILLFSSPDPLVPLELRLASLPSCPCTAIVTPISQSLSKYPLTHPHNTSTCIPNSPLSAHASHKSYMAQISLPGLIDHLAGEELVRWRERNWGEGLNAGDARVAGSFGVGGGDGGNGKGDKNKDEGRPRYIIHTHAPNFTDKSYSTPLVKQLLVNCYHGALIAAMGIAEREERERDELGSEREKEKEEEEEGGAESESIGEVEAEGEVGLGLGFGSDVVMEDVEDVDGVGDVIMTGMDGVGEVGGIGGIGSVGNLRNIGGVSKSGSFSSPASLGSPSLPALPSLPSLPPLSSPSLPPPTTPPSPNPAITLALPSLSTGRKSFPPRLAARIAVSTVRNFLRHPIFGARRRKYIKRVVFCVWPIDSPNRKALQVALGRGFPPRKVVDGVGSGSGTGTGVWLVGDVVEREGEKDRDGNGEGVKEDGEGDKDKGGDEKSDVEGNGEIVDSIPGTVITPPRTEHPSEIIPISPVPEIMESEEINIDIQKADNDISKTEVTEVTKDHNHNKVTEKSTHITTGVVKGKVVKEKGKKEKVRKESYRQMKRKQGLRLAAANRARREKREGKGKGKGCGDGDGDGDGVA